MPFDWTRLQNIENREGVTSDATDYKRLYEEDLQLLGDTFVGIDTNDDGLLYNNGGVVASSLIRNADFFGNPMLSGQDTGGANVGGHILLLPNACLVAAPSFLNAFYINDTDTVLENYSGLISLLKSGGDGVQLDVSGTTDLWTQALQDTDGTIALTDDIPITTKVYKTADETVNNSVTLQNDDDLLFAIGANEVWAFKVYLLFNTGTPTNIKFNFTAPTGYDSASQWSFDDATQNYTQTFGTGILWRGGNGSGFNQSAVATGVIMNGSNAGTLQMKWAQQNATVADTKVLKGSYLIAERIA